jgi:hypothetical protein
MKPEDVSSFCESDCHWEKTVMVRAMIECLSLADLCHMLRSEFLYDSYVRDAALRSLASNEQITLNKEYRELLEFFIHQICVLKRKESQAAGLCLLRLAQGCEASLLELAVQSLLDNKYIGNRRRGYKLARNSSAPAAFVPTVKKNWDQVQDLEAARFLIEFADPSFIVEHRHEFTNVCQDMPWLIAKIYIAAAKVDPSKLQEIREIDPITFMYVATKIGHKVSDEEAMKIFETSVNSDRLGLLIWCLGRMRLSTVLIALSSKWQDFEAQCVQYTTSKYSSAKAIKYA